MSNPSELPPEVEPPEGKGKSPRAGRRRRRSASRSAREEAAPPPPPEVDEDAPEEVPEADEEPVLEDDLDDDPVESPEACTRRIIFQKACREGDGVTIMRDVMDPDRAEKALEVSDPSDIPEAIGRLRKASKIEDGDTIMVVEILHLFKAEVTIELVDKLNQK